MNTNTYYIKAKIKSFTTKLKLKITNSIKYLDDFGFQNQTKNRLLF